MKKLIWFSVIGASSIFSMEEGVKIGSDIEQQALVEMDKAFGKLDK